MHFIDGIQIQNASSKYNTELVHTAQTAFEMQAHSAPAAKKAGSSLRRKFQAEGALLQRQILQECQSATTSKMEEVHILENPRWEAYVEAFESENYRQAIKLLDTIFAESTDAGEYSFFLHCYKADCLALLGSYEKAAKEYAKALADPKSLIYWDEEIQAKAHRRRALCLLLECNQDSLSGEYILLALAEKGDLISHFLLLIDNFVEEDEPLELTTVKWDELEPQVALDLAQFFCQRREFTKALEIVTPYAAADDYDYNKEQALVVKAKCLASLGRGQQALEVLDLLIEESSPGPDSDYVMARSLLHFVMENQEQALSGLKELISKAELINYPEAELIQRLFAPEKARAH